MKIAQATNVVVLNAETYSSYTLALNSNSDNQYTRSPAFTVDPLSYSCINDRDWNPDILMISNTQTLTKSINTLAFTSGLNHYQVNMDIELFLIDVTSQSFSVQIASNNGATYSFPESGQDPYIFAPPNYCTESLAGNSCVDYCSGSQFDSQIQIVKQFAHLPSVLTLTISSSSLTASTFIGVYSLTVSVETCDTNCLTCQTDSVTCLTCPPSLPWLQVSSLSCMVSCLEGEYQELVGVNSRINDSCIACATGFCKTCTSSACSVCMAGYYLNGTVCSVCNATLHCKECLNGSTCSACVSGYFLDTDGITCVSCPTECSKCTSLTTCTLCQNNYFLNSGSCTGCDPMCPVCVEAGFCVACWAGNFAMFSLVQTSKFTCVLSCGSGYFVGNDDITCVDIYTSNCGVADEVLGCTNKICDTTYAHKIRQCVTDCGAGYYKYDSGTELFCLPCPTGCTNCSSDTLCSGCIDQYYLGAVGSSTLCIPCSSNCLTCSLTGCSLCDTNYYLNGQICSNPCPAPLYISGVTCQNCNIQYCGQCKNNKSCLKCSTGRVPVLNNCYTKCAYGYYRLGTTQNCAQCPPNCGDCTSSTTCDVCMDGYYLTSGACAACDPTCATCTGASASECLTCKSDSEQRFLFMNQCVKVCPDTYYSSGFQLCTACTDPACQKCSKINQCLQCTDNTKYLVDYTNCLVSCPGSYQTYVNTAGILICSSVVCSTGFQLSSTTGQCEDACGDGAIYTSACDDGNLINGDGCDSSCSIEPHYACEKPESSPSVCQYQLLYSLKVTSGEKNIFYLVYEFPIQIIDQTIFRISVEGVPSDKFSYSMDSSTDSQNRIQIRFTFLVQPAKNSQIIVENSHDNIGNSIHASSLNGIDYEIPQRTQYIVGDLEYEVSSATKQAAEIVSFAQQTIETTFLVSIVPLTISGNINFIAGVIDVSQIIRFHVYLDVVQTYTLQIYLDDFQGFNFPFITNVFAFMLPEGYYKVSSIEAFERNKSTASYMDNTGSLYSLLFITMAIHLICFGIGKVFPSFQDKTKEIFIYGAYVEWVMQSYIELVFYVMLQCTNMDMEGLAIEVIGQIIMWIVFIGCVPLPFYAAYLMKKHENQLNDPRNPYSSIWKGLKRNYYSRLYFVYIHVRKLWFSIFFFALHTQMIVQMIFLMSPSIALAVFVYKKRPFIGAAENIKILVQEICMVFGMIGYIILKACDDEDETTRLGISWMIIGFFTVIMVILFVSSIIEIFEGFFKKPAKIVRKYTYYGKVHPAAPGSKVNSKSVGDLAVQDEYQNLQELLRKAKTGFERTDSSNSVFNLGSTMPIVGKDQQATNVPINNEETQKQSSDFLDQSPINEHKNESKTTQQSTKPHRNNQNYGHQFQAVYPNGVINTNNLHANEHHEQLKSNDEKQIHEKNENLKGEGKQGIQKNSLDVEAKQPLVLKVNGNNLIGDNESKIKLIPQIDDGKDVQEIINTLLDEEGAPDQQNLRLSSPNRQSTTLNINQQQEDVVDFIQREIIDNNKNERTDNIFYAQPTL